MDMAVRLESIDRQTMLREWDNLAKVIYSNGKSEVGDLSLEYVLSPGVLSLCGDLVGKTVVDAGAGAGLMGRVMAKSAKHVTCVEPSLPWFHLSQANSKNWTNMSHVSAFFEDATFSDEFDIVVANMVLQNVVCAASFLGQCFRSLRKGGVFVFSIPHPCFWPRYWAYEQEPWFSYQEQIIIQDEYRTTALGRTGALTTHIHRPLETYFLLLKEAGFSISALSELWPLEGAPRDYVKAYVVPRFLAFQATQLGTAKMHLSS